MVDLNQILKDHPYNPDSIRHLVDEIKWAMDPFSPQDVTVYVNPLIDFAEYKVYVEVKSLPGYTYSGIIDVMAMRDMYHPEDAPRLVGQKAGEYFRSIRIEPDDNIILGEN